MGGADISHGLWMSSAGTSCSSGIQRFTYVPWGSKLLALQKGIEDAEVGRRIRPAPGDPLPARRVVAEVGIDQRIPEPALAILPWLQQVLDEEGCRDHPRPVVHDARGPQLAHPCIDDRIARLAALPAPEGGSIGLPRKVRELRPERLLRKAGDMMHQMIGELSPQHLLEKLAAVVVEHAACGCHGLLRCLPDLMGRNLAPMQMG